METGGRGGSSGPCSRGGVNIPQIQPNRFAVTKSASALSGGPQWVSLRADCRPERRGFNPQWLRLPREQWPCGTAKIVKRETVASLEGLGIDLAGLANLLTAALDRKPVVDKTGLTGKFDIHLEYGDYGNLPD